MSKPRPHPRVKFFAGVIRSPAVPMQAALDALGRIATVEFVSEEIGFDAFTSYYEPEMGAGLIRFWVAFLDLMPPDLLPEIKAKAASVEDEFAVSGRRTVNIDPGYITQAKVVLASFKDFSHRIYLRDGVFADMQLAFRGGRFVPMEWTFPDYRSEEAQRFFLRLRERYRQQLRSERKGELNLHLRGRNGQ